jgi:hypothetical protein
MNKIVDPWASPGDLLSAVLEGWVVAEISDLTLSLNPPEPAIESRRERGIQSARTSRTSVSERFRAAR